MKTTIRKRITALVPAVMLALAPLGVAEGSGESAVVESAPAAVSSSAGSASHTASSPDVTGSADSAPAAAHASGSASDTVASGTGSPASADKAGSDSASPASAGKDDSGDESSVSVDKVTSDNDSSAVSDSASPAVSDTVIADNDSPAADATVSGHDAPDASDGATSEDAATAASSESPSDEALPTDAEDDITPSDDADEPVPAADEQLEEVAEEPAPDALGAGVGAPSPSMVTSASPSADVSGVSFGASETNPGFGRLDFDITDALGETYHCLVTGLKDIGSMTAEIAGRVAQKIADAFVAGKSATVGDDDGLHPIDAEKYSRASGGDSQLCWSATAADMLSYAGWSSEGEDAIHSDFTDSFTDSALTQAAVLKYALNGVNSYQNAGADGNAAFPASRSDVSASAAAQQLDPGTNADGTMVNDALAADIPAETVVDTLTASENDADALGAAIIASLDAGDAVSAGLRFKNSAVGHAVTLFGYIKDALGSLKALLFADPDSDIGRDPYPEGGAAATQAAREALPDSLTLGMTGDDDGLALTDYGGRVAKLDSVTTLKNRAAASGRAEKAGGTRDAVNTPDPLPVSCELLTGGVIDAGQSFRLRIKCRNMSYTAYDAADDPYLKVIAHIRDGSGAIVAEPVLWQSLSTAITTGRAMSSSLMSFSYSLPEDGAYSVDIEVEGVHAGKNGSLLPEAYVGNNLIENACAITIGVPPEPEEEPEEEEPTVGTRGGEVHDEIEIENIPCFNAAYVPCGEALRVPFALRAGTFGGLYREYVRDDGRRVWERVDEAFYDIADTEEGLELILSADYMATLPTGETLFRLLRNQKTACYFDIEIL